MLIRNINGNFFNKNFWLKRGFCITFCKYLFTYFKVNTTVLKPLTNWCGLSRARNGGTNTGRRETKRREWKRYEVQLSQIFTYRGTRTPRGMFPSSIRSAPVTTSICSFLSLSPSERVPEKWPNSLVWLWDRNAEAARRETAREWKERRRKKGSGSGTEAGTWWKKERRKLEFSGCISSHISSRLFTRQWFQPRPDKNYSNGLTRCKFHMGIPSTSGALPQPTWASWRDLRCVDKSRDAPIWPIIFWRDFWASLNYPFSIK